MTRFAMPEMLLLAMPIAYLAWLAYTVIRRPDKLRRILADMAERRRRRRETLIRVSGGAAKAGMNVFKQIRR